MARKLIQKKISSFIFLMSLIFILTPLQAIESQVKNLSEINPKKKEEVILIQSAHSGIIEKDKTKKDSFKITLHKVMPYLSYVDERPNRNVGKITLEEYLKMWSANDPESFQNDPPNAIIHASNNSSYNKNSNPKDSNKTSSQEYFTLVLSEPKYDPKTETLVYQAKQLVGDGENLPESATFNHMTVIIDGICIGCWN